MKVHPYREALQAAKKNLVPGLILQTLIIALLIAYLLHDPTRKTLEIIGNWKSEYGYAFSFLVLAICAGVIPELLRVACFENFRYSRKHLPYVLFGFFYWGSFGIILDVFYQCQAWWLGPNSDLRTVILKTCVDVFLFCIFISCPLPAVLYRWRDREFRFSAFKEVLHWDFVRYNIFPLIIACWAVWIPVIVVIYIMPPALQFPVCTVAEIFWALLIIAVTEIQAKRDAAILAAAHQSEV